MTPNNMRPPPPHPPPGTGTPDSPSPANSLLARRTSAQKDKQRDAAMPPPTFIPSHGQGRPPATPEQAGGSPATAAAAAAAAATAAAAKAAPAPAPSPHALPVKEWEGALRLDIPITNIARLPTDEVDETQDATLDGKLPAMSELEKAEVKRWIDADKAFVANVPERRKKLAAKVTRWMENEDQQTPWWQLRKGEPMTRPRAQLQIIYPTDKAQARFKQRKRREVRL